MKIVTIVGARPQFIKASAFSRALAHYNDHPQNGDKFQELIVHTGQHFDVNMSQVFFDELEIPRPKYNLEINSLSHGAMTGMMLAKIEEVLVAEKPDLVLVYGDTNSTMAGTLAASKIHIPVAHVEAGLRSFNMRMPEEINRIVSDRLSSLLFCPTENAVENLSNEGIETGVYNVGDIMYDVALYFGERAVSEYDLSRWDIKENEYALCTIHRAENTVSPEKLREIFAALHEISQDIKVILPMHPRTRKYIEDNGAINICEEIQIIEPVSYLEMVRLEISARVILTDSGGVQKEAFFHKVPCITLREETEWVETVSMGWNTICGANKDAIVNALKGVQEKPEGRYVSPYGNGKTAEHIIEILGNDFAV